MEHYTDLAGEGRVAVQQDGQHLGALSVPHVVLLGAHLLECTV